VQTFACGGALFIIPGVECGGAHFTAARPVLLLFLHSGSPACCAAFRGSCGISSGTGHLSAYFLLGVLSTTAFSKFSPTFSEPESGICQPIGYGFSCRAADSSIVVFPELDGFRGFPFTRINEPCVSRFSVDPWGLEKL
jgi:hypothetical protein